MAGGVRKGTPWTWTCEERASTALVGPGHPAHRKASLTWNLLCGGSPGGKEKGTLNKGAEAVVLRGYSMRPQEEGIVDQATRMCSGLVPEGR